MQSTCQEECKPQQRVFLSCNHHPPYLHHLLNQKQMSYFLEGHFIVNLQHISLSILNSFVGSFAESLFIVNILCHMLRIEIWCSCRLPVSIPLGISFLRRFSHNRETGEWFAAHTSFFSICVWWLTDFGTFPLFFYGFSCILKHLKNSILSINTLLFFPPFIKINRLSPKLD